MSTSKKLIEVNITCPFCRKNTILNLPEKEVKAYNAGALAQHTFKSLDATQREVIISGMCPECQRNVFGY